MFLIRRHPYQLFSPPGQLPVLHLHPNYQFHLGCKPSNMGKTVNCPESAGVHEVLFSSSFSFHNPANYS